MNSILEIKDSFGCFISSFEGISNSVYEFYSNLFKEPSGCQILDILKVIGLFPKSTSDESSLSIQEVITEKEILSTYPPFKKVNSMILMG
jgi:hypothetical protein